MGDGRDRLVERDRELELIGDACRAAMRGEGRTVLVSGPAGVGRTALLAAGRRLAAQRGLTVLAVHGGPLERDIPFLAVWQLLRPWVESRFGAVAGDSDLPAIAAGRREHAAVIYDLIALTRRVAASEPLAIVIDDCHWLDAASLSWLEGLALRGADVPVLVLLAERDGESPGRTACISGEPGTTLLALGELSEAGTRSLLARDLGAVPSERFARAAHQVTRGNPLLLSALAGTLLARRIAPVDEHAAALDGISVGRIARIEHARIGRLGDGARALADALAVFGEPVDVRLASGLADLPERTVSGCADALATAGVLAPERPLAFRHPIVRAALYHRLSAGTRSDLHARAARLLAERDAPDETRAEHLLRSDPMGCAETVELLRRTAARALAAGRPARAAACLRRALAEPATGTARVETLLELAAACARVGGGEALAAALEAAEVADDSDLRARAAAQAASALIVSGESERAARLLGVDASVPALIGGLDAPAGAALAALRDEPAARVATLVRRALADGALLARRGPESPAFIAASIALLFCDLDAAAGNAEAALAAARERGSVVGTAAALTLRAVTSLQRGRPDAAAADARTALRDAPDLRLIQLIAAATLAEALAARGATADAEAVLADVAVPPDPSAAWLLDARASVRLAADDSERALADAIGCGAALSAAGLEARPLLPWRRTAAVALLTLGREDEALRIAREAVDGATEFGDPRALGIALHTLGLAQGAGGAATLRRAVEVLATSAARLEHARALLALGAALRRNRHRNEARDVLREALDAATRCAATALQAPIREELGRVGARPRRGYQTGVEALTDGELRVARLAAGGRSNPEIARELFISRKTVESHLRAVYRKLDVSSREALSPALVPDPTAATS